MIESLRDWLAYLKDHNYLKTVSNVVDLKFEMSAIIKKLDG